MSITSNSYPTLCNMPQNLFQKLDKIGKRAYLIMNIQCNQCFTDFTNSICLKLKDSIIKYDLHPFRKLLIVNNLMHDTQNNCSLSKTSCNQLTLFLVYYSV